MKTVIRLKRPLEESPSDTLILNCNKKQKLEIGTESIESLSTVLKFSGTQTLQDFDLNEHVTIIRNSIRDGIEELVQYQQKLSIDEDKKVTDDKDAHSKVERYKVVNYLRSNFKDGHDNSVTVLDIEREDEPSNSGSDQNYVYDLYYTDAELLEAIRDYHISIQQSSQQSCSNHSDVDFDKDSVVSNTESDNVYLDSSDEDSMEERGCRDVDLFSSEDEAEEPYYYFWELDSSGRKLKNRYRASYDGSSDESEENFDDYD